MPEDTVPARTPGEEIEAAIAEPAQADLAPLRQVLAVKTIERENATDIAPGQLGWLPRERAAELIKSGHAADPAKAAKGKA